MHFLPLSNTDRDLKASSYFGHFKCVILSPYNLFQKRSYNFELKLGFETLLFLKSKMISLNTCHDFDGCWDNPETFARF